MLKLAIKPYWVMDRPGQEQKTLPMVLSICAAIHDCGNLVEASRRVRLSYRHAWGVLQETEKLFGVPLVKMTRGRGAELTEFGQKLLWADKRIAARLSPILETLASELQVELERTLSQSTGILRIHASHGFAVAELYDALKERQVAVELKYVSSQDALASLERDACDLAGFHVPIGELQQPALRHYVNWLRPRKHRIINLATRTQGLMVAPGNPKKIFSLKDLQRRGVRFVNRQTGSGTRILLDLLLDKDGLKGSQIVGFETAEFTHAAIAAYVASGMADVGFGIETGARRFDLDFIPVATERYFFASDIAARDSSLINEVLKILNSKSFKVRVNKLPGYDAKNSGTVMSVGEAFAL